MQTIIENIIHKHMMRRGKKAKNAFIDFLTKELEKKGYSVSVRNDKYIFDNKNIVIGDENKAKTIITAHYDTPSAMPFPNLIYPLNKALSITIHALIVFLTLWVIAVLFIIAYALIPKSLSFLVPVAYLGALLLVFVILFGVNNKKNYNDNTSGVVTLLTTLEKAGINENVAYILFDNEEWGAIGSKGFVKAMGEEAKTKNVINLDCVGEGDEIIIASNDAFSKEIENKLKEFTIEEKSDKKVHFTDTKNSYFPSDQKSFQKGAVICTAMMSLQTLDMNKEPKITLCHISKIHTDDDRVLDMENVEIISDMLASTAK